MPCETLLSLFGGQAVEFLVAEVQKYREVYSVGDDVSALSSKGRADWSKVVEVLKTKYGDEATNIVCWRSWRSLRRRYLIGFRNPERSLGKWKNKLSFLNDFAELQPRDKSLTCEYGEDIVKTMLAEVVKYPCFHNRLQIRKTANPDELRSEDRRAWSKVMEVLDESYKNVPSTKAWKTLQNLYLRHSTDRASKKWMKQLEFLDYYNPPAATPLISPIPLNNSWAEQQDNKASSTSSIVVLEPEPPTYETYFQSVSCAPSLSGVSVPQTPPSNDSFKAMLKLIHGKIRKKRNSEAALNAVRRAALKIIADLHARVEG